MNQILNYSVIANQNWAHQAFMKAYAGEWWRLWWLRLCGKNGRLINLNRLKKELNVTASRSLGVQLVPITRIVGSEGRSHDFTMEFRPTQKHTMQRWIYVAHAAAYNRPLPPVDLILIDTAYFVRDGHHRVSVARYFGQTHIEAEVTSWLVDTNVYTTTNRSELELEWQLLRRMRIF